LQFLPLVYLFACTSNPDGFSINATVQGDLENGTKVYLKRVNELNQPVDVDTTTVEKWGNLALQEKQTP